MANLPGPQPEVRFCPRCREELRNIPREEMRSRAHIRADGTQSEYTHTYECTSPSCGARFEINQDR